MEKLIRKVKFDVNSESVIPKVSAAAAPLISL